MRLRYIFAILALLALAVPAAPAQAGGVVSVCDEAHLLAALAGGGTVTFTCSGTITLASGIRTADYTTTTIDGSGQTVTISGNNAVPVFFVHWGATLNLNGLTVANGRNSSFGGGGIENSGTVTVSNCTFSGNNADGGGGIYNYAGNLTVNHSTFSGNSADHLGGGGIHNSLGTAAVSNSTFSGNHADGPGGGISNRYGTLTVSNSTFYSNSVYYGGGAISNNNGTVIVSNSTISGNSATYGGGGGGIYHLYGTATLNNTIVANSTTGGNCVGGAITDGGGNLSYPDTTCPGVNADPLLGPLQDNGGSTWTMALGEGSAAIDAADDAIWRGFVRPWGAHCDIGAVEQIQEPSAVSVSTLRAQSLPGTITPAMVAGLLLLVLVAVGSRRRPRPMG